MPSYVTSLTDCVVKVYVGKFNVRLQIDREGHLKMSVCESDRKIALCPICRKEYEISEFFKSLGWKITVLTSCRTT